MLGRLLLSLILLLALSSWVEGKRKSELGTHDSLIDIDYYPKSADDSVPAGSGSGDGSDGDTTTDDEDMVSSGSGSGMPPAAGDKTGTKLTTTTIATTTKKPFKPRTPCEQLRESSKHLIVNYVPRCTETGEYDSLQCQGFPGTSNCWCADLSGAKIPGTDRGPSHTPDCEKGANLPACIFQLVQHYRSGLLGQFKPVCTGEGYFEKIQCRGSVCYCVEKNGTKIEGTEVYSPDQPTCKIVSTTTTVTTTSTIAPTKKLIIPNVPDVVTKTSSETGKGKDPGYNVHTSPKDEKTEKPVDMEHTMKPPEGKEPEDSDPEEDNKTGEDNTDVLEPKKPMERPNNPAAQIMAQPGLLAAIIGGAVVGLLCAVLLVMFIVYRMKKKDEGSYALDEPRRMPNYPYTRAPDKEFYA